MSRQIEFYRVYRRIEVDQLGNDHVTVVSPTIEIIGNTSVKIYGSNKPHGPFEGLNQNGKYTPPIADNNIESEMTLTETRKSGFHGACISTQWIAFVPVTPSSPPVVYDSFVIDWEFDSRRYEHKT